MRLSFLLAAAVLGTVPLSAEAQVRGAIVIGGLPVGGVITFGDPGWGHDRYGPARVVVVERWHPSKQFRRFDARRYRPVVVWYDRRGGHYLDRARPGLVRIVVYERGGRYYWPGGHDRYDDRYYDRYDGRYDDRYYDRYDGRYDRDRYDDRWDRERDRKDYERYMKDRERERKDRDRWDRNRDGWRP